MTKFDQIIFVNPQLSVYIAYRVKYTAKNIPFISIQDYILQYIEKQS